MREDDNEFRHYVPLLRRIIILVAVITAVPVVLWTITAFVRTYVGPPRLPSFHQLVSSASINTPSAPPAAATPDGTAELKAAMQAKLASQPAAMTTGAADQPAAPKGPMLGDRAPEGDASAAAPSAPTTSDPSGVQQTAMPAQGASALPPSPLAAAENANPASIAATSGATDDNAEALPPAAPLTGPVPLPRHRPREAGGLVHTADVAPSRVPMPRPRPDAAGAAGDSGSANPVGFIQNLFH
jgi:hypothetical protein